MQLQQVWTVQGHVKVYGHVTVRCSTLVQAQQRYRDYLPLATGGWLELVNPEGEVVLSV